MGMGIHELQLMRLAAKRAGALGRVATMGRQGLGLSKTKLERMGFDVRRYGEFCDDFLRDNFGATSVESFDYSDFEGATHIADLNAPLNGFHSEFDTVLDFGTSEHIFNAPQAIQNISVICKPSGQIIHALPANNFCNHGFWQFSPELFFALYSAPNGYKETEIFLYDVGENNFWYEVKPPRNGHWDYLASSRALTVLVRTVKGPSASFRSVQQAQYVSDWTALPPPSQTGGVFQKVKSALRTFGPLKSAYRRFVYSPDRAIRQNRQITKVSITSLV